jgi:hypothetical protein
MMKKKKPLLILLGIIFIILIILLLVFSNKKNEIGTEQESSLRRFFSFGSRTSQTETGNETGADYLNGGINPLTGREYTDEELRLLRLEQERLNREQETTFAGQQPINPFNPNRERNNRDSFGGFGNFGDNTEERNPLPPPTPTPINRPNITRQGPICSDTDLYITFTNEEKARIAKLEQRFYAIAETIASDEDVQQEESNYSNFKIRSERFAELNAMCEDVVKAGESNPFFSLRVPTPFWKDDRSKPSFIYEHIQASRDPSENLFGSFSSRITGLIRENDKNITYTMPLIDTEFKQMSISGGIPYNWFEILYRLYIW